MMEADGGGRNKGKKDKMKAWFMISDFKDSALLKSRSQYIFD